MLSAHRNDVRKVEPGPLARVEDRQVDIGFAERCITDRDVARTVECDPPALQFVRLINSYPVGALAAAFVLCLWLARR
jgi:hypothetical protein